MRFTTLNENSLLLERLDDFLNRYPNIPRDVADRLLNLDPTYNVERDSKGNYCDWIFRLYSKGEITESNFDKVSSLLKEFDSLKKRLTNKDINSYKTVQSVEDAINSIGSDTTEYKRTPNAEFEQAGNLVYYDSTWDVYVPKDWEGSCKLGLGTTWCTANSSSDYHYNSYARRGTLYINISLTGEHSTKSGSGRKLQVFIGTDGQINCAWPNDSVFGLKELVPFLLRKENAGLRKFYSSVSPQINAEVSHYEEFMKTGGVITYTGEAISADLKPIAKGVIVADSVTELEDRVFADMQNLEFVKGNSSVESIGGLAFSKCTQLTSVTGFNNVVDIGSGAFFGCVKLKEFSIPNTVENMETFAFKKCESLTTLTFPGSVGNIPLDVCAGCSSLSTVKIEEGVTSIIDGAFTNCTNLKDIYIPNSLTFLDSEAFIDVPQGFVIHVSPECYCYDSIVRIAQDNGFVIK